MTKFQNGNILWSGRNIQSLSFPLISLEVMNVLCQIWKYKNMNVTNQALRSSRFIDKTVDIQFEYSVDMMS